MFPVDTQGQRTFVIPHTYTLICRAVHTDPRDTHEHRISRLILLPFLVEPEQSSLVEIDILTKYVYPCWVQTPRGCAWIPVSPAAGISACAPLVLQRWAFGGLMALLCGVMGAARHGTICLVQPTTCYFLSALPLTTYPKPEHTRETALCRTPASIVLKIGRH